MAIFGWWRRRQAWLLAAHARGGVVGEAATSAGFEATLGECRAFAEQRPDDVRPRGSRVRVAYLMGSGPPFVAVAPDAPPALRRALPAPPGSGWTEDHAGAYILMSPAAEHDAVHGSFGPTTVRLLERLGHDNAVACDGKIITVQSARPWDSLDRIEAALDLAAQLAHFDLASMAAMKGLRGGEYEPPRGAWDQRTTPRAEWHGGGNLNVRLEPRVVAGHRVLVAVAPARRKLAPLMIRIDAHGTLSEVLPGGALPPDAIARLPVAAPAVLAYDGAEVQVRWERLDASPARVQAGVEIAAAFAATGS